MVDKVCQLLYNVTKYQNNNVKHSEKCRKSEIELMIYLTGSFIRFIITIMDN